ncbi:MAG: hypothetical protein ACYCY8_10170, partial [Burkholderiales bacterium]
MQKLKVFSRPTDRPDTFQVFWTNNPQRPGGVIDITVLDQVDDKIVIAELRAIQYLLEERQVLGDHVIGNANTRLTVSQGAIRKLKQGRSDKAHLARYAEFLCTRFAGCRIEVDKDDRVFRSQPSEQVALIISAPVLETIKVHGFEEVAVTRHVLERLAARLPEDRARDSANVWKLLQRIASDRSVREVFRHCGIFTRLSYQRNGRSEGRYFFNPKMNMILV